MLGTQGPRSASPTISLASHTPLHDSHTHTHIHAQSCTLPWLISHNINDQPNCGYTHTIQSYSHAKHLRGQTPTSLCSKPSHTILYSKLKNFSEHTPKHRCNPVISMAHKTLGHHMTACVHCSQEHRFWRLANLGSNSGSTT